MERIIKRAGVKPWPKLFHNLRASRQTELAERYPIHVVCAWLGNSAAIAKEHYLQVTEMHYEEAAQNPAQSAPKQACQWGAALPAENRNVRPVNDLHLTPITAYPSDYPQGDSNPCLLAENQTS